MRILVVEDEKKVASFIKKGLEEELFQVDTAGNGKEGLDRALHEEYDLIISDIMMPQMSGIQMIKELRGNNIETPILLLTIKDSTKDKVDGLDSGADDYLTKPFAFEELIARVRALLRRKETQKSNVLTIDNLRMDLVAHKVLRDNKEIILTPREYSILEYLLRNKNKIVSRTKLIEHVYDFHFDSGTNVIDVYINKLRSKIDQNTAKQLIQTVRGTGYIIKEQN
ncbi:MAG: response regulator transcription factor [Bacteroidetes bacterium]|nr:response regulator transcription factor [Bacteroidota bacterium]MCL6099680.1 response regulator transcription factor [Bacteroidota bacterium]